MFGRFDIDDLWHMEFGLFDKKYHAYTSEQYGSIQLEETPLGKGGEGNVFAVVSPDHLRNQVAKIYHPGERMPEREFKLRYMIAHPPRLQDDYAIIWPQEIVFEDGKFAGFLMARARGDYDASMLSSLRMSRRMDARWKEMFSRSHTRQLDNRLQVCKNIANAVEEVHQTQKYVLVDIKPENIKVDIEGKVSLIDMDSVEISEHDKVLFAARKLSVEYAPPEFNQYNIREDFIPQTWDRFSLAVVLYKILLGIHPFAVSGEGAYQKLVSHEQKIRAGLFPHGSKARSIAVIPPPHKNFKVLPERIQELFLRALDRGHEAVALRPEAGEWVHELHKSGLRYEHYINPFGVVKPTKTDNSQEFEIQTAYYLNKREVLHTGLRIAMILSAATFLMGGDTYYSWFAAAFSGLLLSFGVSSTTRPVERIEISSDRQHLHLYYSRFSRKNPKIRKVPMENILMQQWEQEDKRQFRIVQLGFDRGKRKELLRVEYELYSPEDQEVKKLIDKLHHSGLASPEYVMDPMW